jgi:hypothetical protein
MEYRGIFPSDPIYATTPRRMVENSGSQVEQRRLVFDEGVGGRRSLVLDDLELASRVRSETMRAADELRRHGPAEGVEDYADRVVNDTRPQKRPQEIFTCITKTSKIWYINSISYLNPNWMKARLS